MTIDIIGAGIGGLTTAIAFQKMGIDPRIFEQANEIKPVGSGIIMANNAMQVYDKLGIRTEIEQSGNPISSLKISDQKLKTISSIDLKYFEEKYQIQNIAIHRGKLQEILASHLEKNRVYLGYKLKNVEKSNEGFNLNFENGANLSSKTLIGADGLNSTVRKTLFPKGQIRNTFQVCWRGVSHFSLPKEFQNVVTEAWGQGDRFGFVKINPQHVYWFAVKSFEVQPRHPIQELESFFKAYHSIIHELIQKTPQSTIHTAILKDLKPINKWWNENVCLIGDAAHASTPNLGQGACQAIEDAYILAACMNKYEVNQAFANYQRLRRPKAHRIVNASWRIGKIAHWKSPIATKLRSLLMKTTPEIVIRRQLERTFELETI